MSSFLETIAKDKAAQEYLIDPEKELKFLSYNVLPLNVLASGRMLDGGILIGGIGQMAAPSATAKTLIGMSLLKEAQRKGMDCILFDCERTWTKEQGEYYGINWSKEKLLIFQTPEIAEISAIVAKLAEGRTAAERANTFIMLDSWAALVSARRQKKEEAGAETQMMGGDAVEKNALANQLYGKGFTCFIVNQVYSNLNPFGGDAYCIPGGNRLRFSCDNILLAMSEGKKTKDDDNKVNGKIVPLQVKKARGGKEFGKLSFKINHKGGLDPWYGLLDDALEYGIIEKPKAGKYCVKGKDKLYDEEEIYCQEVWVPVAKDEGFKDFILRKYTLHESQSSDAKKEFSFSNFDNITSDGEVVETKEEKPKKKKKGE